MKPFNLEEAKAGKPVCTRAGDKVRIFSFDVKIDDYPILAAVNCVNGKEEIVSYTVNGKYCAGAEDSVYDLMMKGEKRQGWIGIYQGRGNELARTTHIYSTRDETECKLRKSFGVVNYAVKQIEWEDYD